jgi:hypothetical protein
MKAFRISIAGSMGVVLFFSIGFAAFRSGSEIWFRLLYSMTVGVLLVSTLAARYCREAPSAFWFGFAIIGWVYLLLGLGLRPGPGTNAYGDVDEQAVVNDYLITTDPIKRMAIMNKNYSSVDDIGKYGYDLAIGHLMVTWVLAALGGLLACLLHGRRSAGAGGKESSKASLLRRFVAHGRILLVIALSGVGVASLMPISIRMHGPYFPDKMFHDAEQADAFLNDEYGRHLESMREPSLWRLSRKDEAVEIYRFLRLHPKQHPICVRVERRGSFVNLRLVILDGVWVDEPGLIAIDKNMPITIPQWDELVRRVERSGLWALGKDDRSSVELFDNNRVLVEGMKGGRYHAVARWSGFNEQITCQDMCEYMLNLANTVSQRSNFQTYDF